MGTRAVYSFKDEDNKTRHVFKHWDNYPSGAMHFLNNALPYAWPLPRFEACEFSASFIAGNKQHGGGDFRITEHFDNHWDLDYRYEITLKDKKLWVKIFERDWDFTRANDYSVNSIKYKLYNEGYLEHLAIKYPVDWDKKAVVNG